MAYPKIKELREKKGLTQQQLAEKLDMPLPTYRSYETGAREPTIDFLIILSDFYDITTDYLLDHQLKSEPLNDNDIDHAKKYHSLDTHGKKVVDVVTDIELERVSEKPKMIRSFRAASSVDNHEPEIVEMEDLSTIPEYDGDDI